MSSSERNISFTFNIITTFLIFEKRKVALKRNFVITNWKKNNLLFYNEMKSYRFYLIHCESRRRHSYDWSQYCIVISTTYEIISTGIKQFVNIWSQNNCCYIAVHYQILLEAKQEQRRITSSAVHLIYGVRGSVWRQSGKPIIPWQQP